MAASRYAALVSDASFSRLGNVLRALRSRNYRLFFFGQVISLIGNWLTTAAIAWLVYRLTGSEVLLGTIAFAGQIPAFLIAPFAGVFVDRWNLQKLLVVTQTLAMVQSFVLAYLTLTQQIQVNHLLVLAAIQGVINGFDLPARQSFAVELVDNREDLPNAIALNSSIMNGARVLGPSAAGILIALVGEGWCFLLDGISYIAVIIALLMMRVAARPPRERGHPASELKEGFTTAFGFPPMRALLLLLALVSLLGVPFSTLLPVFAQHVLQGGPKTFGALSAAVGVGAFAGSLFLASRTSVLGLGRIVGMAAGMFGVALVLFSFSRSLPLSLALLVVIGCAMVLQLATINTLLQTMAEDEMRGRVMSIFTMAFMGMMPLGSLLFGALAERFGAPFAVRAGACACLIGAITFSRVRPRLRKLIEPIYVRKGILPEVAAGLQQTETATGLQQGSGD